MKEHDSEGNISGLTESLYRNFLRRQGVEVQDPVD